MVFASGFPYSSEGINSIKMPWSTNNNIPSSPGISCAPKKPSLALYISRKWMFLPMICWNCSLYGVKETPPCMNNSNEGHISEIIFFPVISSIRLNKTNVHVGTPETEVTFSLIVFFARVSILPSHSSINATLNSGVRSQWPQKGMFCNRTALRSP